MYQVAKNTPVKDQDKQIDAAVSKLKTRFKTEDEYKKRAAGTGTQREGPA